MTAAVHAGDWPQILGPQRSGVAEGEKLPDRLPSNLSAVWRVKVGAGYGGPAVAGQRVILFHRVENQERLEAWELATGKPLWKTDFVANYRGGIDPDNGPRSVPVIAGDNVLAFGAAGDLHCVALADGKKRWSRSLFADYDADEGYFGAGSTPIALEGRVLVNVGGKGAGIVGLDLKDGRTAWQVTDEAASYSSPASITREGKSQAVFVTRMNAVAISPTDGKATVLFPFGKRGPTVNAATPLVFESGLFVTASYGVGAVHAKWNGAKTTPVWENDDTLSSQFSTPVLRDGFLYGIHGREDIGVAELRCVALADGKVHWSETGFGVAHLILAGDKLVILKVSGELVLAAADPRGLRVLGTARVSNEKTRPLPALAQGRLVFRSSEDRRGELQCLVLAP
jgi:outer membrane protein assembly factor BamB